MPVTTMEKQTVQVPTTEMERFNVSKPVTKTREVPETVRDVEMRCDPPSVCRYNRVRSAAQQRTQRCDARVGAVQRL